MCWVETADAGSDCACPGAGAGATSGRTPPCPGPPAARAGPRTATSSADAQLVADGREAAGDLFRRDTAEVGRQQRARRAFGGAEQALVLDLERVARRLEVANQLAQQRGAHFLQVARRHAARR